MQTSQGRERNLKMKKRLDWMMNNAIILVLLVLLLVIILLSPDFISISNFRNILTQSSTRIIMALGVGGIIVAKGTDLSVGRSVGLAAVISASLLQAPGYAYKMYPNLQELPVIVPILLVMLICGFFGLINGFVVAKLKVDPFVATLGMMVILYGVNSIYFDRPPYGAQPIGGLSEKFTDLVQNSFEIKIFGTKLFSIPHLIILAVAVILIIWFLWNKTKFGKNIFAIGGNQEAAMVSGVNVVLNLLIVYALAGALYGLAGACEAGRIGTATNNTGNMYELDAISACIVGGLSFSGGIGTVKGIVTGVLIFQLIAYGLTFIGVNTYLQFIIKGLIIIAAVAIDSRKYIKKK